MKEPTLYHPLTSRPYPARYFDSDTVETLLLLAAVDTVPLATIAGWTDQQRAAAGNWALRSHIRASDQVRVRVPPRPDHVPPATSIIEIHDATEQTAAPAALERVTGELYGEGLRRDGSKMYQPDACTVLEQPEAENITRACAQRLFAAGRLLEPEGSA